MTYAQQRLAAVRAHRAEASATSPLENASVMPRAPQPLPPVMTSREIAALTGKLHVYVLRDIEELLDTLDHVAGSGFKSRTYPNGRQFIMDRDATFRLIAKYDAESRKRIIDRWQELDATQTNTTSTLENTSMNNMTPIANQVSPFLFESKEVRVVNDANGEPLFVAKDVLAALGYAADNVTNRINHVPEEWKGSIRITTLGGTQEMSVLIDHVPSEWKGVNSVLTPRGSQELSVLTEQGLYFFLGRSDKPKALPFQKWLAGEVVPSIHATAGKTGAYSMQQQNRTNTASTLENTSMNNMTRTITVADLPVITHQNVRVITTELLAALYGTDDDNIYKNFSRNQDRFIAGKHFFKLEGEDPKKFNDLHCLTLGQAVEISPRIRHLTLWTERGAARHAKILDTDAAWEVFEQLEDAYFNPREAQQTPVIPQTKAEALRLAADLAEELERKQAALDHAAPRAATYDRVIADKNITVGDFARKLHGVNTNNIKADLMVKLINQEMR